MMKSVTIDLVGPQCPRCRRTVEVREHDRLRKKHLQQPYYRCNYADCRTALVMLPRFIVWNHNSAARRLRRLKAIREQNDDKLDGPAGIAVRQGQKTRSSSTSQ
jgi:hypothetical protein